MTTTGGFEVNMSRDSLDDSKLSIGIKDIFVHENVFNSLTLRCFLSNINIKILEFSFK